MIQDPSMRADVGIPPLERSRERGRSGELDWLLDDLVVRVREVRHAVVLSNDGLAVGASSDLGREDAEHLAAVASGFHSLAKGAGRHFGAGGVRQTMVEMDDAFLFVAAAGEGSCLAVLTAVTADIGLVAYEMARLVKRVGEHLYTPPRAATHPSTATYPSDATRPPAAG
jgi:predicted regulator of Ras-like GTPase activity (Roadblock/LC7/MglB family)